MPDRVALAADDDVAVPLSCLLRSLLAHATEANVVKIVQGRLADVGAVASVVRSNGKKVVGGSL